MNVDIYIRGGGREIRVPWLPETIEVDTGSASVISYDIMNRGQVSVPSGTDLAKVIWESEFPGKYRTDKSMMRGPWKDPGTYDSILKSWKENRTVVNLMVTGYPINMDVYVEDYTSKAVGGFGDIQYKVAFVEKRSITIKSIKEKKNNAEANPDKRDKEETTSYTIKSGDTLWAIAQKHLGSGAKWETIYNANKEIIESTAKKRWSAAGIDRDSQHGHWIFAGTKIEIPTG